MQVAAQEGTIGPGTGETQISSGEADKSLTQDRSLSLDPGCHGQKDNRSGFSNVSLPFVYITEFKGESFIHLFNRYLLNTYFDLSGTNIPS